MNKIWQVRHHGLVVSAPAWDRTGCELDSWQCRIYIPCSLSLRLLGSLRGLWVHMAWHKNCVKKKVFPSSRRSCVVIFYRIFSAGSGRIRVSSASDVSISDAAVQHWPEVFQIQFHFKFSFISNSVSFQIQFHFKFSFISNSRFSDSRYIPTEKRFSDEDLSQSEFYYLQVF